MNPSESITVDGHDYDSSLAFSLAFGWSIALGEKFALRPELEYSRLAGKTTKSGHITPLGTVTFEDKLAIRGAAFNLYADITAMERFVPYLGFGIGAFKMSREISASAPRANSETMHEEESSMQFAPQIMIGADYVLGNEKTRVGIEYRIMSHKFDSGDFLTGIDTKSKTVLAKIRHHI